MFKFLGVHAMTQRLVSRMVFFIEVKFTKYGKGRQLNIIDFFKRLNNLIKVTPFFFEDH